MRDIARNLALWAGLVTVLALALGHDKPLNVLGLFIVSGLAVGSLYALGGIGLVVLYRATGVLNLAAGAIGAVAVMVAWQLVQWGVVAPLAWALGLAFGPILATAYGRGIAPRMAWREPVVKAVASLGFAFVLLGLVSFLWSDDPRKFELPTDKAAVVILGLRVTVTRLLVVAAAILLVIGISAALGRTRVGLQMRALANNRRLSSLIGIPITRVETLAWALSGLLFGFTGLMFGDGGGLYVCPPWHGQPCTSGADGDRRLGHAAAESRLQPAVRGELADWRCDDIGAGDDPCPARLADARAVSGADHADGGRWA